tara:strand:- start:268 stop:447 length:180 start_codon:yes stop_codon:yes gene_type:complete
MLALTGSIFTLYANQTPATPRIKLDVRVKMADSFGKKVSFSLYRLWAKVTYVSAIVNSR